MTSTCFTAALMLIACANALCVEPPIRGVAAKPPFSFVYGGRSSVEILASWRKTRAALASQPGTRREAITYSDPETGLAVSVETTRFEVYSAVEWVLRFENKGRADTPILERVLPLDLSFAPPAPGGVTLHYARASTPSPDDFMPLAQEVSLGKKLHLTHYVLQPGKRVEGYLPFLGLEWPKGGLIGAVGWTGQWEVSVERTPDRRIVLRSGQQDTYLKLHPGESIRTPRILLLEWKGEDRMIGHNQLRRLLLAHYVPRLDGRAVLPPVSHTSAYTHFFDAVARKTGRNPLEIIPQLEEPDVRGKRGLPSINDSLNAVTLDNQLDFIRNMPAAGVEVYWMDAGWFKGEWPNGVGNWEAKQPAFPSGLKALGDAAHQRGLKFLLWFEPERVGKDSTIAREHPEWLIQTPVMVGSQPSFSLDLGNPGARKWITELLSSRIAGWGIDVFRNDRNACPLPVWRAADAADRKGITEIRGIEGLYAMWDALLERHPGLMIDNGNWRVTGPDIEVMRRSVGCLTRSETAGPSLSHPVYDQMQTASLSMWVPLHATLLHGVDPYTFRSAATMGVAIGLDLRSRYIPIETVKHGIEELKSLRPYWLGDYYPLTPIDNDESHWCGWQFDRPDMGSGFATLFRRPKSRESGLEVRLRGLRPKARYEVTFAETYDVKDRSVKLGRELSRLPVTIASTPGSLLIRYRRIP